jgi:hypothetical protein
MTYFTQLGLSGSPDKKPETNPQVKTPTNPMPGQRPHSDPKKPADKQKTVALVGSLIATSLLGVFLLESGCSKESDKAVATTAPNQTVTSQPTAPLLTPPIPSTPVASQPPAKKKSRQRKLSASTYANPTYGVSFRYPKIASLKEGDAANLELDGLGPVEMNFVQDGGTAISAVELPLKLYAGTDLNTAFFNVSVNPRLTSEECEQFAFPQTGDPKNDPVGTSKTKIGATEFKTVEGFAEAENNQAEVKFYHVFQNGSCYEFALGLETAAATNPEKMKPAIEPVDRNEVFRQLNWILSTVKIQPTQEQTTPEVAVDAPPLQPTQRPPKHTNNEKATLSLRTWPPHLRHLSLQNYVDGNLHARMHGAKQVISATDVVDVHHVGIGPPHRPGLNHNEPIAGVLKTRHSFNNYRTADVKSVLAAKIGPETVIRDTPTGLAFTPCFGGMR